MSNVKYKIGNTLDLLKELDDESVQLIVTSPPYWGLRDYGDGARTIWDGDKECDAWYGQLGLEPTLDMYLDHLLQITSELKRVLKKDGVMFWNHGDSYGGSLQGYGASKPSKTGFQKPAGIDPRYVRDGIPPISKMPPKCMILQNYRLILKMIDEQGWILRNDIIWHKPNNMPSSVKDRFTNTYEHVFLLVKNKKYYFNLDAVRIPHADTTIKRAFSKDHLEKRKDYLATDGYDSSIYSISGKSQANAYKKMRDNIKKGTLKGKNPGDVWTITTKPYKETHFATFPPDLVVKPILSSSRQGDLVLDPFAGSGTVGEVCQKYNRDCLLFEINPEYETLIKKRCHLDSNLEKYGGNK